MKKAKRLVYMLLAVCMMFTVMFFEGSTFDAYAEPEEKVLLDQNFDGEAIGSTAGWTANTATPNITPAEAYKDRFNLSVKAAPDGSSKAFEIKCHANAGTTGITHALLQKPLGEEATNIKLTYDVYLVMCNATFAGILPVPLYTGIADAAYDAGATPIQLQLFYGNENVSLAYSLGNSVYEGTGTKLNFNTWYTFQIEVDTSKETYTEGVKVSVGPKGGALTELNLPEPSANNTPVWRQGTTMNRISAGFGGNLNAYTDMYLDNITAMSQSGRPLVNLDFEQETVGQQPSGWTIHPNTSGNTAENHYMKVEQDALDASNQIVRMHQTTKPNASHSFFMRYGFMQTKTAVLSYRFKMDNSSDGTYLPALVYTGIDNNEEYRGSPLLLFINGKTVSYGYADGRWDTAADLEWNVWHEVVMMVDLQNNQRKLFINGKEVDLSGETSTDPYPDKSGMTMSRVSAGFYYNQTNRNIYLDDLRVWESLDLEAVSFGGTDFTLRQNDKLTLEPVFLPLGAPSSALTYSSADPTVATVDANGVVTGVKVGSTTVTVTSNVSGVAPVTLNITVDEMMTGTFTDVPAKLDLPLHGHVILDPALTLIDKGDNSVEIISEDDSIVTVDEWNEVLAIAEGQTNVVVRSVAYPWIEVKIPVTVAKAPVMRTIYVSPNGTGDGSRPSAATSLDGALTILAGINKAQMTGNVEVILAEGYYYRTETLALNETHGGNNLYSVVFKAAENADVTIGGAMHIAGSAFTKGSNGIYVTNIPEGVATRQMYVNNIRATRATSTGPLSNAEFLYEGSENIGITCTNTELLNCTNPDGLEIINAQFWGHRRVGVREIRNGGNGTVQLIMDQPAWAEALTGNTNTDFTIDRIKSYENSLVLLDQPGEWYLDEVNNKLYYMPRAYEDMSQVTITLALLDSWDKDSDGDNGLVSVQGTDYDSPVQNITFQGITFADTTYMRPSSEYGHKASEGNHLHDGNESDGYKSADSVIAVKKANGIHFMDCDFTRLGTTGVKFQNGAKNSRLIGNRFYDISGSAILIGEPDFGALATINRYPSDVKYLTKNIDIQNNYIHHIGLEFQSASGIYVGFIPNVDIIHNEIYETAYSGTYVGLGWNTPFDNLLKNLNFSNNYVHDYLYKGTSDGGGFYTNGNTAGNNSVTGNYFQNQGNDVGALYFDNGATRWNAQYNVVDVSKTRTAPNSGRRIDWGYAAADANNLTISNNFYKDIDSAYFGFNASYLTMDNNTKVAVYTAWPAAAQQIINNSGVEAAYQDPRHHMAVQVSTGLQEGGTISLTPATSFQFSATATDARGRAVDVSDAMRFVIGDKSIVTVSDTGLMTGLKAGTTTVQMYVVSNNIEIALQTVRVTVSDALGTVGLEGITGNIEAYAIPGTEVTLNPTGTTLAGTPVAITQATYQIADESIASVDANGVVSFYKAGQTTLTMTASAGGNAVTRSYTLVAKPVTVSYMDQMFRQDQWSYNGSGWTFQEGVSITAVPNGTGTYTGMKFGSELLTFYMKLERQSAGSRILFRVAEDGSTAYAIEFTATGTVLKKLAGAAETNLATSNVVLDSQIHRIQLGAFSELGSARIVLYIDDVEVINYLASGASALTADGYFGITGGSGDQITLYKSQDTTALETAMAKAESIDSSKYSAESYAALTGALATAEALMSADPSTVTTKQVMAALADLENTIVWLEEGFEVNLPLTPTNPPTGDDSPLLLFAVLALAAACGMLVMLGNKRRIAAKTRK